MSDSENTENFTVRGDIVVVDQDEAVRAQLNEIFTPLGADVHLFDNPGASIKFMQNQAWTWRPTFVICELVMSGISGYELIRRCQELFADLPIIVLSQLAGALDISEAEMAGASVYVTKPLKEEAMLAAVKDYYSRESSRMIVKNHLLEEALKQRHGLI